MAQRSLAECAKILLLLWATQIRVVGSESVLTSNVECLVLMQFVRMFIARYSDLLDTEVMCDACNSSLPGRRYRCLECVDVDLCIACFAGGIMPLPGEHKEDHDLVQFVYVNILVY